MKDTFIQELDTVLSDFIKGKVEVKNYHEYLALERIAVIVNRHRPAKESFDSWLA